jgi:hypothetical protein
MKCMEMTVSRKIDVVYNDCRMAIYEDGVLLDTVKDFQEAFELMFPDASFDERWDMDSDDFPVMLKDLD